MEHFEIQTVASTHNWYNTKDIHLIDEVKDNETLTLLKLQDAYCCSLDLISFPPVPNELRYEDLLKVAMFAL